MAYEGYLKDFLELSDITVGDTVKVTKPEIEHEGMLLEKPDYSNENTIIIKLSSGYNIGIAVKDAKIFAKFIENKDIKTVVYPTKDIPAKTGATSILEIKKTSETL